MHVILNMFLLHHNAHSAFSLCKLKVVCKELNQCIEECNVWSRCRFTRREYDGKTCRYCNRTPLACRAFVLCGKCIEGRTISATECKRQWNLNDNDLSNLTVSWLYIRRYRKSCRFFYLPEVREFVLIKHGGTTRLQEFLTKKEQRILRLRDTKRNKAEAVRQRTEDLVQRLSQEGLLMQHSTEACDMYINNKMDDIEGAVGSVRAAKEKKDRERTARQDRKEMLMQRLAERGLALRDDSAVCSDYISGKRNDIDEVVTTMMQMNYFFTRTKYKRIMNRLITEFKQEIRDTYGYMPYDEYHELMEEEIPRLSERAKRMAVRGRTDVPEYCNRFC